MEKIVVRGGNPLYGDIEISGMKNAAVAVIIATLLVPEKCVIENLPAILDVKVSLELLKKMGAKVKMLRRDAVEIDTTNVVGGTSDINLVRKMRASYYLIGAELGRFGRAYVGYPGGCDFGVRPIDQHIKAFETLGATVNIVEGGYIEAVAENGLCGANVFFDMVTVGATMNLMLAAVRTSGVTVIENAAHEPHIVDLANFLNTCGAKISGAGTDTIKIKGVDKLHGCNYTIIPDMIEAGTFMIAAAATGGCVTVKNIIPKHIESISAKLEEMGVDIVEYDDSVMVSRGGTLHRARVRTLPYPGFPTDLQPQMGALFCVADGDSFLTEGVWENRFRYIEELKRMGASVKVDGRTAVFTGGHGLSAANVRAVDLRAGAAMIIAALVARGKTEIENIYLIERGYDDIVSKFASVGADIQKIVVPDSEVAFEAAN